MATAFSILSRVARSVTRAPTPPSNAIRVVASSPATTTPHHHQRRPASTHASPPATRTITTKSKSRGPARPMPEGEPDPGSHTRIIEPDCEEWPVPRQSAQAFAMQNMPKWAHKTAIVCGLTGRSYTHAQLYDGILRFGGALQQLEAMRGALAMAKEEGKGPTVAILSPNSPEYPVAFFGSLAVGGTVTTINPAFTPAEIARHLKDSDTKVLVVDALLEPLADAALGLLGKENKEWVNNTSIFVSGKSKHGRPDLRDIMADPNIPFADVVEPPLNSTAILPYSSGTTGLPKGVCLSHNAFNSSVHCYHHPQYSPITSAEGEGQEVLLGLLPFYHIYGMLAIMTSGMINGAKTVTMPQFDPQAYMGILAKHKVSLLHMVPPLLNFMALSPACPASVFSSVLAFACTAAPVPPTSAALLMKKAGRPVTFQEGYGMTETLGTHLMPKGVENLGSCGKVMSHARAKVVDIETGELLPPGQPGELCIDASSNMTGYHNNEKATREAFDDEGWLKTGDMATYDEEGFFTIVDRLKELIKVKGIQVAPSELEDVLLSHPGVADAGVVGVPNDKAGEVPRAYVVPRSKDVKAEELSAFVASQVARHKHLVGGVKFVEQLPKNQTGKLLRRELRRMANEE